MNTKDTVEVYQNALTNIINENVNDVQERTGLEVFTITLFSDLEGKFRAEYSLRVKS